MDDENGLVLDFASSGRNGCGTLTAKCADEVIHVEYLNIGKSKSRQQYVSKVCDNRPKLDRKALEDELMKLAANLSQSETSADPAALPELDAAAIVRPERFIMPEVSGLAVPTMTTVGDKVQGRWHLYLRWADGKRERRPMSSSLELPNGRRLFIHPEPAEPTPNMKAGWDRTARRRWFDGEAAPNAAEVFKDLCERIAYFLDLPREHAKGMTATLAVWIMLTYGYSSWDAVPYLYIGGPLGSGKSRVFEILLRLVFRPLSSSNMTGAALFRTLHSQGGVLLLDEAERLRNTTDPATAEILSMLLAGYKRGGTATRLEPLGDNGFRTLSFDVYGPKALACIAGLPPALASRAIPLMMFRSPPGSEKPRRRIDTDPAGWQRLRDDLHALALEHGPTWLELPERGDVCPAMSGRDYELWQPLLALASWIESHGARGLLKLLQEHALRSIDANKDEQTPDADETLLRILTDEIRMGMTPTPGDILAKAQTVDAAGFKMWKARGVSEHLKRYGAVTHKSCGRKVYKVTLETLRTIQTSYGVDLGVDENLGES
ncbi:MAG: hypothetical protein LLF97_08270 [Planctomycetaceae bacterium]|nr:hypothetical protein [Planctomycetaceae bacterium]